MQFCRAFAFIEALRMIEEKGNERGMTGTDQMESVPLSTEGIKAIQAFTVAKATQFATLAFPLVSFPDETERESIPFSPYTHEPYADRDEKRRFARWRTGEGITPMQYLTADDYLAGASDYEEQQSAAGSPSFRLIEADLDRQMEKARGRQRRANKRKKQSHFSFVS